MTEMKDIYQFIQNILHICCIICIFIIAISEIQYISDHSNIELVTKNEMEGYNFTYLCSILNILNTIFLLWLLLDKKNSKIMYYAVMLFMINLIIGFWCVALYCNLKIIGRFNEIIIIQFNIFLIECSFFGLFAILSFYKYLYETNDEDINYVILAEPITKDNI